MIALLELLFSLVYAGSWRYETYVLLFQTFNDFFVRELKPGARPIAYMERDDVAVCAADSRLMAFKSVQDSLRFWIKVWFTSST